MAYRFSGHLKISQHEHRVCQFKHISKIQLERSLGDFSNTFKTARKILNLGSWRMTVPQQVQSRGLTLASLDPTSMILEVTGDRTLLHVKVYHIN